MCGWEDRGRREASPWRGVDLLPVGCALLREHMSMWALGNEPLALAGVGSQQPGFRGEQAGLLSPVLFSAAYSQVSSFVQGLWR